MAGRYKLRCSVVGHEKDVRAVVPTFYPENGIVSASRDVTARVWVPNEHDLCYTEAHVMSGHKNFVNCVCVMPPDEKHPHGLIMTGSNDNMILAFTLDSPAPVYKLEGHANTVCSLAAGKFGTLVSGSWDETAKVWLNQKCLMTLTGHSAAVWCVTILPEGGFMLTGSADKTIKMWKAGKCEKTFTGHTDCVRGMVVLSTTEFLSCANDATIRRWSTAGVCLHTYYSHNNYVYSIALLPNGMDFVTSGEDRTMRVWRGGECVQTLTHPTESVWSVCVTADGDIVTGASDGIIRVFSCEEARQASAEEQTAYEEQLAGSSIPSQLGDIPTDQLSGPEALINPGKKDGQHLMVKDEGKIVMYQWDAADKRWAKIGDVVGGSGGSQASSGKQLYMGKEYDYVFDVELQEGVPAMKLPYNLTEDPWMAAHNFLANNDLSQLLLDQVANFIVDQTKNIALQSHPAPAMSDPFTGGGRYIPNQNGTSDGTSPAQDTTQSGTDPFTGAGRYVPTYTADPTPTQPQAGQTVYGADPLTGGSSYKPANASAPQVTVQTNHNFPQQTFLTFDQANINGILGKLREFNSQADSSTQMSEAVIERLQHLMSGDEPQAADLQHLAKLLHWPAGVLFPVLDVIRLSIRTPIINQYFCNQEDGAQFLAYLLALLAPDALSANQMLSFRILCNIFRNDPGRSLLLAKRDAIITSLVGCRENSNKNIQIALSTVLLNYAVLFLKLPDIEAKSQCLSAAVTVSESHTDPEASYRLLVCIGTLVSEDADCTELAKSLGVSQFINRCKLIAEPAKVSQCANQLEQILK